jgi:flagellar biosynthetic protein FliQ
MSQTEVMHLASRAMLLALELAAPILLVSLAIGVLVSLFQAVTQVQEMTLTFVPKLAGVAVVLVVAGGWMLQRVSDFTRGLFESIPRLVGAG